MNLFISQSVFNHQISFTEEKLSVETETSLFIYFFFCHATWLWDISSPTWDRTQVHGSESESPNHWTTREFPEISYAT